MKSTSSIIFILIVTGIATAFFLIFFEPAAKEIKKLQSNIGLGRHKDVENQMVSQVLTDMTGEVDSLKNEVENLKNSFLNENKKDLFMKDLRSLFHNAGFHSGSVLPSGKKTRPPHVFTLIDLKGKNRFENIYKFLLDVEDLVYAVKIEKLIVTSDIRFKDLLNVEITLSAPLNNL